MELPYIQQSEPSIIHWDRITIKELKEIIKKMRDADTPK